MEVIKERIISKSLDLFTQIGVKVITMDMICDELGISKRTLYEHFSSKEDLIKQVFKGQMNTFIEELNTKLTHIPNSIKQLSFIFEYSHSFYFCKGDKISFQLQKFYFDIYSEILNTQNTFIKSLIENNIVTGIKDGLYRSKLTKDLVVEYVLMILYNMHKIDDRLCTIKDHQYFLELLLRSIATKKGLKEL